MGFAMTSAFRSSQPLQVFSAAPNVATEPGDLEIARARMRHLARWHVEPLPGVHAVNGTPIVGLTEREHRNGLAAARPMAVHILNVADVRALHNKE